MLERYFPFEFLFKFKVDFARNRIFDDNDSIMDLLRTSHSSTSLVVCPEKRGNLARFLNGINNSKKNSLQKKNVNFHILVSL